MKTTIYHYRLLPMNQTVRLVAVKHKAEDDECRLEQFKLNNGNAQYTSLFRADD